MKVTYTMKFHMVGERLFVDAWDIYNQIVGVLPQEDGEELLRSFKEAEKKLKGKSGK